MNLRKIITNSIIVLLFCLSIPYSGLAENNNKIVGVVTDMKNKICLYNAKVILIDSCNDKTLITYTDMYGIFYFDNLFDCNSYKISVSRPQINCDPPYFNSPMKIYTLAKIINDTIRIQLFPIEDAYMSATEFAFFENSFLFCFLSDTNTRAGLFDLDSSFAAKSLGELVTFMKCDHSYSLEIESYYTKAEGDKYKDFFAILRADYISSYLVKQGIERDRIKILVHVDDRKIINPPPNIKRKMSYVVFTFFPR